MRALLIINPRATSMTGRDAGLVVRSLGSRLELDTRQTQYRGHAGQLAAECAAQGCELVVTLGGDGTVNEVVNGLMQSPDPGARPALVPVPGGGANVFARTLGLPTDVSEAVRRILSALDSGERRKIGLGQADEHYFTFSAGLGVDAEAVGDMERKRAHGRRETPLTFLGTAVHRFYRTYLGRRPVRLMHSDFSSGLDLLALRRLRTLTTLGMLGHMMHARDGQPPTGRDVLSGSALSELSFTATRPIAFHIDGEYLGETESVAFRFVPDALCVIA